MRRLTLLAVLMIGLAACGGSGASKNSTLKMTFGLSGGTMMPYSVTVAPDGSVTTTGNPPGKPKSLSSSKDAELSSLVRNDFSSFTSQNCPGTFPDESAMFITALGKTVTVRGGGCEPAFATLWEKLMRAVGATPVG